MVNIKKGSTQRSNLLATGCSITLGELKALCMKWLFPGLISALVIGPQPWVHPIVGQTIVLVNDLAAAVIIIATFRDRLWPLVLIACILLAKAFSIFSTNDSIEIAYIVFADALICIAGAIIAVERSRLVYTQLMIICLLSVPFMVMQSAGVGGLSQLLSTSYYDYETAPDVQNTLFTPLEDIAYDVRVFRPAGLFRTGTLVTLIALFALPFHLSRRSGRFPGGTAILCAMLILSMGKLAIAGSIVIVFFILLKGNSHQRFESMKALAFMLFFFLLYSFFFPGLLDHNLGSDTENYSLFVRLNDIVEIFPEGGIVREMADPYLVGSFRSIHLIAGEHVSGIPSLLIVIPYLLPFLVILAIIYLRGYRSMRAQFPRLLLMCVSVLLGIILYPLVFPIWGTPLYWFMMSFALLPVFFKLFPHYFRNKSHQSFETI